MDTQSLDLRWLGLPAAVVGISIIISAGIIAHTWYSVRALDNTFTVTGSAKQEATADSAKWTLSVDRSVLEENRASGYTQVARDTDAVIAYVKKQGITDDEITRMPISSDVDYSYNQQNGPRRYSVRQSIVISTKNVALIQKLSTSINELVSSGVLVTAYSPEYYVSTLPDLRVQLLGKAIEDAHARASEIANSSQSSVGKLKSAASGVVQVLSPGSAAVDDYGAYDTSSIEKEVMVTVRATFLVR